MVEKTRLVKAENHPRRTSKLNTLIYRILSRAPQSFKFKCVPRVFRSAPSNRACLRLEECDRFENRLDGISQGEAVRINCAWFVEGSIVGGKTAGASYIAGQNRNPGSVTHLSDQYQSSSWSILSYSHISFLFSCLDGLTQLPRHCQLWPKDHQIRWLPVNMPSHPYVSSISPLR
jgi:hypothetical protein